MGIFENIEHIVSFNGNKEEVCDKWTKAKNTLRENGFQVKGGRIFYYDDETARLILYILSPNFSK